MQVNIVGVVGLTGTYTGVVASNSLNKDQYVYMDARPGNGGAFIPTPANQAPRTAKLRFITGNAIGTMTVTPTPHILPLQSIFDLANDGRLKFFQGTGSLAADNTVMTQFNCSNLVFTGFIQPFDASYTGTTFGGTVLDNAAVLPVGWNYNWTPTTVGPVGLSGIGTTGEHDYLGP